MNVLLDFPRSSAAVSRRRFSAPFDGDATLYVFERNYRASYDRFERLPLNTPDEPDYPIHYLVRESDPLQVGAGVVEWTRTYSRIPSSRREGESYAWTMPGLAVEALYAQRAIDNAGSVNISDSLTRITTATHHALTVGDFVRIAFTIAAGDSQQSVTVQRTVRSVLSLSSFTVDTVLAGADPFYLVMERVEGGRDPVTRLVHSILQYDYFLPSLPGQPKRFEDIPILEASSIIDGVGKETDTYSVSSTPTKAKYLADVAAGKLIVAEGSVVRRWMGNIYERQTRFVRAQ